MKKTQNQMHFSLIIALYNEGPTLDRSIKKIYEVLNKLDKSWEVIFVEDNSKDNTRSTFQKLLPKLKNTQIIYHDVNKGRGKTVTDGIIKATGEICGFLDVDLEVSADYIPLFIEEIENGSDMVVGKRFYEKGLKSVSRVLASRGYSAIVKTLLGLPISDTEAGYKFFKRAKILPVLSKVEDNGWFWDTEICARAFYAGLKIAELPVLFIRRTDKASTVRLIPDTWDYFKKIVRFKANLSKIKNK